MINRVFIVVARGWIAWLVGTVLGTVALLIWLSIYTFADDQPTNDSAIHILMLPIVLPIAAIVSFPIAFIPTYVIGGLTSAVLRRTGIQSEAFKWAAGASTGGYAGWALLHPSPLGGEVGLIYGATIGAAWCVCETWQAKSEFWISRR